jgi:hypothetical protein
MRLISDIQLTFAHDAETGYSLEMSEREFQHSAEGFDRFGNSGTSMAWLVRRRNVGKRHQAEPFGHRLDQL